MSEEIPYLLMGFLILPLTGLLAWVIGLPVPKRKAIPSDPNEERRLAKLEHEWRTLKESFVDVAPRVTSLEMEHLRMSTRLREAQAEVASLRRQVTSLEAAQSGANDSGLRDIFSGLAGHSHVTDPSPVLRVPESQEIDPETRIPD